MGQIFLVRHGQASFGQANYDQLSPLGEKQAGLLGDWFAQRGQAFQRVVCGDMRRHEQTAMACLARIPGAPQDFDTDAGFNEYDHHEVLVRHRPDFDDPEAVQRFLRETPNAKRAFQQEFERAMLRWMDGVNDGDYRESWPQFQARVQAALKRVLEAAQASQNIVVFTSGGTIATLCQGLLAMEDRAVAELNWSLVNAAVTKLFYQPDRVVLSYLNSYHHLEALGEPGSITYR